MNPLCIYHHNCADGFGAAWACWKALEGNVELYPGKYQAGLPPDELIAGRTIFVLDFSYKRADMIALCARANRVVVLDHHKSAAEDLKDLPMEVNNLIMFFDMERSGARMSWDYFFGPDMPPPRLIEHIEDRDLWRFRLPYTREIQAALFSFPYDVQIWDGFMADPSLKSLMLDGVAIERKHFKDIEELLGSMAHRITIMGYDVPVANLPYTLSSDVGNKLADGEHFAACYWDTKHGRTYSLRSRADSPKCVDVSVIATQFGGGGHKHAAGFSQNWEQLYSDQRIVFQASIGD